MIALLKYQAIAEDLRQKIEDGVYRANDQLPLSSELEAQYGASKMTVKRALDYLVQQGLIVRRRGSGTFVKSLDASSLDKLIQHSRTQLLGMSSAYRGHDIKSRVLAFEIVPAPDPVAARLRLEPGSFVYHIVRVRSLDGQPRSFERSYMTLELIPGLREEHARHSIFSYIRDVLKLHIQSVHRLVKVRCATPQEEGELRLPNGSPVAVVHETYYLDNGQPFNYSITTHEPDHFALETVLVDGPSAKR